MRSRLKAGCVILLDDMERESESAIAGRWKLELGARATLPRLDKALRRIGNQGTATISVGTAPLSFSVAGSRNLSPPGRSERHGHITPGLDAHGQGQGWRAGRLEDGLLSDASHARQRGDATHTAPL